ncbi:acyl-CoA Delta-9 desaturase-like [Lasioglossum baleicum]|uniref:acyl-CoA Delta-9 desaturase-like n=1 Tax=Lasioglossum baleicum TaxID=434251 RepID=UPI003FCD420A
MSLRMVSGTTPFRDFHEFWDTLYIAGLKKMPADCIRLSPIGPAENIGVAVCALGEGRHNYHHVFPWDYKAAELGHYRTNFTTAFIDFFGKIGWAYDMKVVPSAVVQKRASRIGDGSIYGQAQKHVHSHKGAVWGWGDKDMDSEEIKEVEIINKSN